MNVVCPECGAKQPLDATEELGGRCQVCRATLTTAAAGRVFEDESAPRKKKRKKRPPPSPQQLADSEFRRQAGRGVNFLVFALAGSTAALGGSVALLALSQDDVAGLAAARWSARLGGLAAALCAFLAASAWRPLGRPLDHEAPTEWAWRIAAALLPLALLTPFVPGLNALAELTWLAGWVCYLLLVTVVQRICVRIDRGDLNDSATFVLRAGTGAVGFAVVAWVLAMLPLAGTLAMALMLMLFAALCLPVWAASYALLLLRVRAALAA